MQRYLLTIIAFVLLMPNATNAQNTIDANPDLDLLWEQIHAQPHDVGIACQLLNGRPSPVLYNATTPFPLASVVKLIIFIEYITQVLDNRIPFAETVTVADLNRYSLPRTDRGAHDRFIASYDTAPEFLSLWEVATVGMMTYSSNAASDYLLHRLGDADWDSLYATLGLTSTSYPHPLTSIPFLMNNHENGLARLNDLETASITQANDYLQRYIEDSAWRSEEIAYRNQMRRQFPDWHIQSAFLQAHTATSTVEDFLRVLTAIYADNSPLSDDVRGLVRRALRVNGSTRINNTYVEYGSKLGFYSGGTLTLAAYGQPIDASPVISVIFFRNIPNRQYQAMIREDSIGDFAHFMHLNQCQGLLTAILQRP